MAAAQGSGRPPRGKAIGPLTAPIFPLPNVVFFPRTLLPLHIFEPRYCRMVQVAIRTEGRIAMVLAREERPPSAWPSIHRLGTLGKIEFVEPLPDGRYHLLLRGLVRVDVGELDPRPLDAADPERWFAAELTARGEAVPDLQDPRVADAKAGFLMTARRYGERILEGRYPAELLTDVASYVAVVNQAATILRSSLEEKQALLGLDDIGERAERVEQLMRDQLDAQGTVEAFASHRPPDPRRN